MVQGHKYATLKATGCGFVLLPPLTTQCLQNLAESVERNNLNRDEVLGSQVPSVYPTKCGIQREAKKNMYVTRLI